MEEPTGQFTHPLPYKAKWAWFLSFAVGILVVFLFHNRFGLAWDDALQAIHGENCLNFYLSLGKDRSFQDFLNLALYGSVFEQFSAAVHRIFGYDDFFFLRGWLSGLTALGTAFLTVGLAHRLGAHAALWFAGLFLITNPQFWGQAFVNTKDVAFAAAYAAWWLSYLRWFHVGFNFNRWMVLSGLTLGLVIGLRINGLPLVAFTVLAGMAGWILKGRETGKTWKTIGFDYPYLPHLVVLVIGWTVMTITWPTALLNPIVNPISALLTFLDFPWPIVLQIGGSYFRAGEAPVYTFALEQFLSHPLWHYPLFVLGIMALIRRWRSGTAENRFTCIVLISWIFPLFLASLLDKYNSYNGVRQSLFLWPAYACLAALGLDHLRSWLVPEKRYWVFMTALVVLFMNLLLLVMYHPYSYTFRNSAVRLFAGGNNGFDGDYHALSYRVAAEWMDRIAMERILQGQMVPSVAVFADPYSSFCYRRFSKLNAGTIYTFQSEYDGRWSEFEFMVVLHPHQKRPKIQEIYGLKDRKIVHRIENNGHLYALIYQSL